MRRIINAKASIAGKLYSGTPGKLEESVHGRQGQGRSGQEDPEKEEPRLRGIFQQNHYPRHWDTYKPIQGFKNGINT